MPFHENVTETTIFSVNPNIEHQHDHAQNEYNRKRFVIDY